MHHFSVLFLWCMCDQNDRKQRELSTMTNEPTQVWATLDRAFAWCVDLPQPLARIGEWPTFAELATKILALHGVNSPVAAVSAYVALADSRQPRWVPVNDVDANPCAFASPDGFLLVHLGWSMHIS